jgi:formylglycine-generating enzyme required for sulfatase activity
MTISSQFWGNDYQRVSKLQPGKLNHGGCAAGVYIGSQTTDVGNFKPNAFDCTTVTEMFGNVRFPWHSNYNGAPADGSVWDSGMTLR